MKIHYARTAAFCAASPKGKLDAVQRRRRRAEGICSTEPGQTWLAPPSRSPFWDRGAYYTSLMQTTHLGTVVLPPPCEVFKFLFRVIGRNSGRNPRAWPSLCASGL